MKIISRMIVIGLTVSIILNIILIDSVITNNKKVALQFEGRVMTYFSEMYGIQIKQLSKIKLNKVKYPGGFEDKVYSTSFKHEGKKYNVVLHCPYNASDIEHCAHMQENYKTTDVRDLVKKKVREKVESVIPKEHIEMFSVRVELEDEVDTTIESEILSEIQVGFKYKSLLLRLHPSYYYSMKKDRTAIDKELFKLMKDLSDAGLIKTCDLVVMDEKDKQNNDRRIYKYESNMTYYQFTQSGGRFRIGD